MQNGDNFKLKCCVGVSSKGLVSLNSKATLRQYKYSAQNTLYFVRCKTE
jgi:hypothetical protein